MADKQTYKNDHDLLIGLHGKVDALLVTVSTSQTDHETRIRKIEAQGNVTRGALAILVFLSGLIEPFLIWRKH